MRALVIYSDSDAHWASGWLTQGFRHAWVLLEDERAHMWIEHDLTIENGLTARVFADLDYDAALHFEQAGLTVQRVTAEPAKRQRLPLMTSSCVSMCKALLGVSTPWIWTPLQLHRHLERASSHEHHLQPAVPA